MIPAREALERLREGNRRFVAGVRGAEASRDQARRLELTEGQEPFAIVLGCSDSRVPPEIVFDQGLGDLFVIRVAGNVAAPTLVGTIEFATDHFGTQLVVVLGHSRCGAILVTLEELRTPTHDLSPNLRAIVDHIRRPVEALIRKDPSLDATMLVDEAVRANIRASVTHLRHGSSILQRLVDGGRLMVLGAEYSLQTGVVEFLDDAAYGA